jgi:hypothetical protein
MIQCRKSLDVYASGNVRPVDLMADKYRQVYNDHLAALHQFAEGPSKSYLQAHRVRLTEKLR